MTRNRYALNRGELRRRLARGEVTYGTFLGAATPVTAEVCAAAGVDWVLLDLEHGAGGEEQARDVIPAAASYSLGQDGNATYAVSAGVPIPDAWVPS